MAQTDVFTDTGIAELMKLHAGVAATAMSKIVALNGSTPCTAAVGSTFANPASSTTHHSGNGLALQSIDSVSVSTTSTSGDTTTFSHQFTATGSASVAGIHTANTDGDVAYNETCFNAVLPMASSDTLSITGTNQLNQA